MGDVVSLIGHSVFCIVALRVHKKRVTANIFVRNQHDKCCCQKSSFSTPAAAIVARATRAAHSNAHARDQVIIPHHPLISISSTCISPRGLTAAMYSDSNIRSWTTITHQTKADALKHENHCIFAVARSVQEHVQNNKAMPAMLAADPRKRKLLDKTLSRSVEPALQVQFEHFVLCFVLTRLAFSQ